MSKQAASWLIVLVAIAGIAGGLAFYKYKEITASSAAASAMPEPAVSVATSPARTGTWSATTRAIGTVAALRMLELRTETAGTIVKVGFASGDLVEAGQILVAFDARAEQAALAAAEAETRLAELTLERRASLRKSPAFSEQEFDRARLGLATFKARAEALAVAIDKKTIKAPFRARIGITNLQPGAYLDTGTLIATLQGVDSDLFVDFALPQDSAAVVHAGSKVTIQNPAIDGGAAEAVIEAESEGVDPTRRTVGFRARLAGVGDRLRPGMFVDVLVVTSDPVATVFVPLTAVRRAAHGEHVFVLAEVDGKLRARYRVVQTGPTQGSDIAIDSGLQAGELVATAGSFKLNDGALVQSDAPPAGDAQSSPN
jgi:membrane fusion protein (multidrug efflux system)